jgi:hypothetical protein
LVRQARRLSRLKVLVPRLILDPGQRSHLSVPDRVRGGDERGPSEGQVVEARLISLGDTCGLTSASGGTLGPDPRVEVRAGSGVEHAGPRAIPALSDDGQLCSVGGPQDGVVRGAPEIAGVEAALVSADGTSDGWIRGGLVRAPCR